MEVPQKKIPVSAVPIVGIPPLKSTGSGGLKL